MAIDKHVVKAIIDVAIFLEFSPPTIVDPDAAVAAQEQIAAELQQMQEEVRRDFVSAILMLSGGYGEKSSFVEAIPDAWGL